MTSLKQLMESEYVDIFGPRDFPHTHFKPIFAYLGIPRVNFSFTNIPILVLSQMIKPDSFGYVHDMVAKCLKKNKSKIADALIKKIHPDINIYNNSVNIFVGKQGSGKTLSAIEEIIKISHIPNAAHLLIYVSKTGEQKDVTFESLRELIEIPIAYVAQENAEEYVNAILNYKQLYYTIRKEHLENQIIDEQRDEIFQILKVRNFDVPMLQTLILFDDIANNKLLANEKSYFNNLMTTCRHNHISFFLNVQFWKSLSTTIKSNVSTVFVFGTYSKEQLRYITHQITMNRSFDEIYEVYQYMNKYAKIIIDCNNGNVKL